MAAPTASTNMLSVLEPRRYGSMLSLEEKCQQSFFLFYYYRMEDEAVLDRGASFVKHVCDEEEVEGKTPFFCPFYTPQTYHRSHQCFFCVCVNCSHVYF